MSSVRSGLLFCTVLAILGSVLVGHLFSTDMSHMFSRHMLSHILLMNVAAPMLGAAFYRVRLSTRFFNLSGLLAASIVQLLLLFGWHLPVAMAAVMAAPELALTMHISLFVTAVWFWQGIYRQASLHIWKVLAVLLITGKLYCLMAALLVFAPRSLYPASQATHGFNLPDQQLAGVMMVTACPLSYIVIATVLVARWLTALHQCNAPRNVQCVTAAQ